MRAVETSGWLQEQAAKYAHINAGPIVRETFEVSAGASTSEKGGA